MREPNRPNMLREFQPQKLKERNFLPSDLEDVANSPEIDDAVNSSMQVYNVKELMDKLFEAKDQNEVSLLMSTEVASAYSKMHPSAPELTEEQLVEIFSVAVCAICKSLEKKNIKPEEDCRRVFEWVRIFHAQKSPIGGVQ